MLLLAGTGDFDRLLLPVLLHHLLGVVLERIAARLFPLAKQSSSQLLALGPPSQSQILAAKASPVLLLVKLLPKLVARSCS